MLELSGPVSFPTVGYSRRKVTFPANIGRRPLSASKGLPGAKQGPVTVLCLPFLADFEHEEASGDLQVAGED